MIHAQSRPRLASKARLRFDRRSGQYFCLYPERGLRLNDSAAEILALCTGDHTVDAIVGRLLASRPRADHEAVARDVRAFLDAMVARALVHEGA
jgi:pyrroloquinoline quinone biosynthesis protein D